MIDNIGTDHMGPILGNTPLPQGDPANMRPQDHSDATLQVNFADLIAKAKQAAEADAEAVQNARELLLAGRLTSPNEIRSAAESIINLGI